MQVCSRVYQIVDFLIITLYRMVLAEKSANIPVVKGFDGAKAGPDGSPLTKSNLKLLQKSIFELENKNFECPHYLCSLDNMAQIRHSRTWFLFELEMTYDGYFNLRNSCYFTRVYRNILPVWPITSCLSLNKTAFDSRVQLMPLNHIIISNYAAAIPERKRKYNPDDINDIYVEIADIAEFGNVQKYIPPTILTKRRHMESFNDCKVNTKDIISFKDVNQEYETWLDKHLSLAKDRD